LNDNFHVMVRLDSEIVNFLNHGLDTTVHEFYAIFIIHER